MKYILFLFISLNLYSQDIDYLKSQDTIYIVLKGINTPVGEATIQKFKKIELNQSQNGYLNTYEFSLLDNTYKKIIINTENDKDVLRLKRKQFLKEKSAYIVNVDFIDSLGLKCFFIELLRVNRKSKVVYIIDEKSLKKRNVVMRKAFIADIGFAEM